MPRGARKFKITINIIDYLPIFKAKFRPDPILKQTRGGSDCKNENQKISAGHVCILKLQGCLYVQQNVLNCKHLTICDEEMKDRLLQKIICYLINDYLGMN